MTITPEILDRLPPHDATAERAVIGAILLDPRKLESVAPIVRSTDFYADANQTIFHHLLILDSPDVVLLTNRLREVNDLERIGGAAYIAEIMHSTPVAAHAEYHAEIVARKAAFRRLIQAGSDLVQAGYAEDGEPEKAVDTAEATLREAWVGQNSRAAKPATEAIVDVVAAADAARDGAGPSGLMTGLESFDTTIGGLFPGELIILAARPGLGKCLGRGTKVMMHDGTCKAVEQVRDGDLLMGPDSEPRRVSGTTQGTGKLFRVEQVKGMSYVVNEDHVLSLEINKRCWRYEKDERINISVRDYMQGPRRFKHAAKGWKASIEYEEVAVPLDPYFVGVWLGDGTTSTTAVTTSDPEVVHFLSEFAAAHGLALPRTPQPGNKSSVYRVSSRKRGGDVHNCNPVMKAMRGMGLIGAKHIPHVYRQNSRRVRLKLLAGLIDTDGYLVDDATYDIIIKSPRLADDVVWIARSLGFGVTAGKVTKGIRSSGFKGEYWRLYISGDLSDIPVIVPRRQATKRRQKKLIRRTGVSVTPCGVGEYFGFELDGDGLFLLEDFTVTHNTSLAAQIAHYTAVRGRRAYFASLEMSAQSLMARVLCGEAGVSSKVLRTGKITGEEADRLVTASHHLGGDNWWIHDAAQMTVGEIRRTARHLHRDGLHLVVVDYLQRVTPRDRKTNRDQQVGEMSGGLKELARELDVPVLCLAQQNRQIEGGGPPKLSHLRESGNIEQDADMVMFIERTGEEQDDPNQAVAASLCVRKNRNGETGEIKVEWIPARTLFQGVSGWQEFQQYGD